MVDRIIENKKKIFLKKWSISLLNTTANEIYLHTVCTQYTIIYAYRRNGFK